MPLDLTALEKVRHSAHRITARCPACAEEGRDRTGNHLAIFPDGKYACAAHPGEGDHRRRIFALKGVREDRPPDPQACREWREERQREKARVALTQYAREKRRRIIARHPWHAEAVGQDSPQRVVEGPPRWDARHFLASLFQPGDLLWTGETHHSGQEGRHAQHWQTCADWMQMKIMGPMITPATWRPGTTSRAAGNVLTAPYTVLDFDGFDGIAPRTPEQLYQHVLDSLAMVRWLREGLHWKLAAILWTGSKSLHAWFHTPAPEVLTSLKTVAATLGMDACLIGRPEHPCRLPGMKHQKTGRYSQVWWLG